LSLLISLNLYVSKDKTAANWILGVVAIAETLPILWSMWQDVRLGKYGIDILAVTAIVASVLLGQYWAAIVVVVMLTGGQSLEDYAERRAQSELDTLLKTVPLTANVIRKGKTLSVDVGEIKVGDKIQVKPGEVVAVDGNIIDGRADFDEASLTGESLPQSKQVGMKVLSGSVSVDGLVTIKATATAEDSQYQQIIKLVRGAAGSEAPFIRLADRYSLPFTVMSFAIALGVWILTGHAIRFLEVIIVATPCPLLLAAPIALISGMARASRYGIIVKTGKSLERLAESSVIAFDKTGTLTKGDLTVKAVKTFGKFSKEEVIKYAASLEQNSNHVLAQAVVTDAKLKAVKTFKAKHLEEVPGLGLKADIKGTKVLVGSYDLLKQNDVDVPTGFKRTSIDQTAAYVSINHKLAGVITFTDEIRDDALSTLDFLHDLGIKKVVMITGDNKTSANHIAKALGIDDVHAEALPADKLHILSKLSPRPVIYVGDGVNDAPVLTASDVGIAMGARGSTAASESADMVVMLDELSRVAAGLEIAKKTFRIARQSILIGIGLSVVLMLVFATGKFPPLAGAILQEVVDVFVIFNALRAHIITPSVIAD
jgi:heavy metal translocating P-type ATPase